MFSSPRHETSARLRAATRATTPTPAAVLPAVPGPCIARPRRREARCREADGAALFHSNNTDLLITKDSSAFETPSAPRLVRSRARRATGRTPDARAGWAQAVAWLLRPGGAAVIDLQPAGMAAPGLSPEDHPLFKVPRRDGAAVWRPDCLAERAGRCANMT